MSRRERGNLRLNGIQPVQDGAAPAAQNGEVPATQDSAASAANDGPLAPKLNCVRPQTPREWVSAILAAIALAMFILVLACSSVGSNGTDPELYHELQMNNGVTGEIGISDNDLRRLNAALANYLKGDRNALEIEAEVYGNLQPAFNEREILHMEDVRALFRQMEITTWGLTVFGGILLLLSRLILGVGQATKNVLALGYTPIATLGKVKMYVGGSSAFGRKLSKAFSEAIAPDELVGQQVSSNAWKTWASRLSPCFRVALLLILLPLGAFAAWATVDFNAAFNFFHEVLFTNDLWLLDWRTDLMIRMLPQGFFEDIAVRIVTQLAIFLILIDLALWFVRRALKEK